MEDGAVATTVVDLAVSGAGNNSTWAPVADEEEEEVIVMAGIIQVTGEDKIIIIIMRTEISTQTTIIRDGVVGDTIIK